MLKMLFCEIYRDYYARTYNDFRPCRATRKEYSHWHGLFLQTIPGLWYYSVKTLRKKKLICMHAFLVALGC